eukprot:Protomagalhaensia_wolfi_Nauph_80__2226@NODE_2446_length_1090_cov_64_714558_g1917_i0_p1_GENE_NODE_2446_length_1090_cov_64_714558_g1917_i0NODE_2446_length_1090_cov_64_714558_g1917_i0_p1_ORF_typecomplete_len294_score51_07TRF/PF08558_10/42TRF/PF08558_10/0_38_NODE_2446_length_1090_cov_64_714558_g1917_i01341015
MFALQDLAYTSGRIFCMAAKCVLSASSASRNHGYVIAAGLAMVPASWNGSSGDPEAVVPSREEFQNSWLQNVEDRAIGPRRRYGPFQGSIHLGWNVGAIHQRLASVCRAFELKTDGVAELDQNGADEWSLTEIFREASEGQPEQRDLLKAFHQIRLLDRNPASNMEAKKKVVYTIFNLLPDDMTQVLYKEHPKDPEAASLYDQWISMTPCLFYTPLVMKRGRFMEAKRVLEEAEKEDASDKKTLEKECREAKDDFVKTSNEVKRIFMNFPKDFQKLALAHSIMELAFAWSVPQ